MIRVWSISLTVLSIVTLIIILVGLQGCAHRPEPQPQEVVLKIENETDRKLNISIYKSCEGNWNFCPYK